MIYVIIFTIIIFIPLYFSVYLYHSTKDKRLYFAVYLFSYIKIINGYISSRKKGGYYIHIFNNKAIVLDYDTILKLEGNSINLMPAILLKRFFINLDLGNKNQVLTSTLFVIFKMIINCGDFIKYNYPYFDYYAGLYVYNSNQSYISFKATFSICFNLFCIVKQLIANVIKRGIKSAKKFKKT